MSTQYDVPDQVFVAVPPKRRRTGLILTLVVLGLFALGYLTAVFLLFPPLPVPEDGIAVPDLTGQDLDGARERLRPVRLEIGDTLSFPNANSPPGQVVAQSPLPGQQLRAGDRVALGLSSGRPANTVPDVVGMGVRRAENLLERLGFTVVQVQETSERPSGTVIRSTPEAGTRQPLPSRVQLAVSAGLPDTIQIDTTLRRDTLR
jgi:serine/threonine-protein kinase